MKRIKVIIPLIFLLAFFQVNAQNYSSSSSQEKVSEKIEVFYFHFSRRCETCVAVEKVTEETLKKYYPERIKDKSIVFLSIDLDDDTNTVLAEKLKVSGQTLLFVKGNNKKDLSNKAFIYARENPDKLQTVIKETISTL